MKIIFAVLIFASFNVFAEDAETVISVKKGQVQPVTKYEIHEGTEEIAGDVAPLKKTAQDNWKKACADWTKEFKDKNNKEHVISFSCGKMTCVKEGVESTCTSQAKYKLRVLIEQPK